MERYSTTETAIIAAWIAGMGGRIDCTAGELKARYISQLDDAEIYGVWRSLALHALECVAWDELATNTEGTHEKANSMQ